MYIFMYLYSVPFLCTICYILYCTMDSYYTVLECSAA